MSLLQHLHWRYAVKKFDQTKLSEQQVSQLVESIRLAPSAYGLQPYQLIVLESDESKQKVLPYSYGQTKVAECSHLFVLANKKSIEAKDVDQYISGLANIQNKHPSELEAYRQQIANIILPLSAAEQAEMARQQCFIALGTLLSTAALMKIDTCPMTGFDTQGLDDALGLTKLGLSAAVICPVGYRDINDHAAYRPKYRISTQQLALTL